MEELKKKRKVRGGHRSFVKRLADRAKNVFDACAEPERMQILSAEEQAELSDIREVLGQRAELLRKLDEEILDLSVELPDVDLDDEMSSAGEYAMELGALRRRVTSVLDASEAAVRRLQEGDASLNGDRYDDDMTALNQSLIANLKVETDTNRAEKHQHGLGGDQMGPSVKAEPEEDLENDDGEAGNGENVQRNETSAASVAPVAQRPDLGRDLWRQLKPVAIPTFKGDKSAYPSWKAAFMACIDSAPMTKEYKLLQLRQYLGGQALETIQNLGHSALAYDAAKQRLERKFGGQRRVFAQQLELLDSFAPIKDGDTGELEKLADLLDLMVLNMLETKRDSELGDGVLYAAALRKLPERLITQYQRWMHGKGGIPSVTMLREWLNLESEFQTAAREAACGLRRSPRRAPTKSDVEDAGSVSTGQCLAVSAKEATRALSALKEDERRDYVREHKLCFNCLSSKHRARQCRAKGCRTCGKMHHTLLHVEPTPSINSSVVGATTPSATYLMTAVAEVKGARGPLRVRVFFDPGSQTSFVAKELVDQLGVKRLGTTQLELTSFGHKPVVSTVGVYRLTLVGSDGELHPVNVHERDHLGLHIPQVDDATCKRWRRRGILVSDGHDPQLQGGEVALLMGADYCNQLIHEKIMCGQEYAWRTAFGWVLSGTGVSAPTTTTQPAAVQVSFVKTGVDVLWEMDQPVADGEEWPSFPMTLESGRYKVGLLWKSDERPEDNRAQAFATAGAQLRKLERMDGAKEAYDAVIQEYMDLGAVEEELTPETSGYYLPHHAVVKAESTTTKTRIVFNASAAPKGQKSLNDVLDSGPSLLPDLAGMLMRFREKPVGIQADIRKAFFMITVEEEDRRYLRFVWPKQDGEMATFRLARLPFGVNCSPFILTAVLRRHLESLLDQADPGRRTALKTLLDSLYVDDCVTSLDDAADGQQFRAISQESLMVIGMELRKWHSNCEAVCDVALSTVLGVTWDAEADLLSFPAKTPVGEQARWTKRTLLKLVASLFDPLGLIAPYVLRGKVLLQDAWKSGVSWDAELPSELSSRAGQWWQEANQLPGLAFPRWLGVHGQRVVIHLFTDASEKAYGCSIYATFAGESRLLFAKTKVAPLKVTTLARLELQAAYVGVRWLQFSLEQSRLAVSTVHAWSDSMTTLQWIDGQPHRWKTFVANRVSCIQDASDKLGITWHHCPGKDNPADMASRGASPAALSSPEWQSGPKWLTDQSQWPQHLGKPTDDGEVLQETKVVAAACTTTCTVSDYQWWKRYSDWQKILRITQWMLAWRCRTSHNSAEVKTKAEMALLRIIQQEVFPSEYGACQAGVALPRTSRLLPFNPYLDEMGVLRSTGRLQMSDVNEDTKHPVLLASHHLTELMLRACHEARLHQGVEGCLAYVRRRFLVLAGRRLLRTIKKACLVCRRWDAQPVLEQPAPLPRDRVRFERPFQVVGVDYAGPLMVRELQDTTKTWIVLFVCATSRAVSLDLVMSLNADDFLLAYRRFVAVHSTPQLIRSDNGTTFVAASRMIPVDWRFNPPAAPWHGGFYERLVALVKSPLRRVLGRALLKEVELRTVLTEVQRIVNDRPLTYVGGPDDLLPLTPNALLGRSDNPSSQAVVESVTADQLRGRLRYLQRLQSSVAKRWMEEYLLSLRGYHQSKSHTLQVGDVVLVVDDSKKRCLWKMAVIVELYEGADRRRRVAKIRSVRIRGDGHGHTHEYLRPVQRLVPLEVCSEPEASEGDVTEATTAPATESAAVGGPNVEKVRCTRTRVITPPQRHHDFYS